MKLYYPYLNYHVEMPRACLKEARRHGGPIDNRPTDHSRPERRALELGGMAG